MSGLLLIVAFLCILGVYAPQEAGSGTSPPLGLPPTPLPEDNPQTAEKVALGGDVVQRHEVKGDVSCGTCHALEKAFTNSPLSVSERIGWLTWGLWDAYSCIDILAFINIWTSAAEINVLHMGGCGPTYISREE